MRLDLFRLIFSHTILFILLAEYYLFYKRNIRALFNNEKHVSLIHVRAVPVQSTSEWRETSVSQRGQPAGRQIRWSSTCGCCQPKASSANLESFGRPVDRGEMDVEGKGSSVCSPRCQVPERDACAARTMLLLELAPVSVKSDDARMDGDSRAITAPGHRFG